MNEDLNLNIDFIMLNRRFTQDVVYKALRRSIPFSVEPFPDGNYTFTVKEEYEPVILEILKKFPKKALVKTPSYA